MHASTWMLICELKTATLCPKCTIKNHRHVENNSVKRNEIFIDQKKFSEISEISHGTRVITIFTWLISHKNSALLKFEAKFSIFRHERTIAKPFCPEFCARSGRSEWRKSSKCGSGRLRGTDELSVAHPTTDAISYLSSHSEQLIGS